MSVTNQQFGSVEMVKAAPAWRWPVIIVGLLGLHATLMMWAVMKATGDPNNAVIPDYYAKSLTWDQQKAAAAKSDALGWKVSLVVGKGKDALGQREATVGLVDSFAEPVDAPSVEVTYFHQARPTEVVTVKVEKGAGGLYATHLRVRHSGFYTFTVRAVVGADRFEKQWSQYVSE